MKYPLAVLSLFALALSAGCGVDATHPLAPDTTGGTPVIQSDLGTSGYIGPSGGTLSASGVTLVVPARALTASTLVALVAVEAAGTYHVSLEPADLRLMRAATLTIPCSGSCGVLWLDPSTGLWEDLATQESLGGVEAKVLQFSRFESEDTQ